MRDWGIPALTIVAFGSTPRMAFAVAASTRAYARGLGPVGQ